MSTKSVRMIRVAATFGNTSDSSRYDYYVYYAPAMETFYIRGAWGTELANPFCLPKVPSEMSFAEALTKIRNSLCELYKYLSTSQKWRWAPVGKQEEAYVFTTCLVESEDGEALPENRLPVKFKEMVEIKEEDHMILGEEDYYVCEHCGERVPADQVYVDSCGTVICEDCFEDAETCEECGQFIFYSDGGVTTATRRVRYNEYQCYVCDSCLDEHYFHCDSCDEYYHNSLLELSDDNHSICVGCSSDWVRCRECGEVLYRDDAEYDDENDNWYCTECSNRLQYRIRNYSYKPSPNFLSLPGDPADGGDKLYMGVELEIDGGNDPSECAYDILRNNAEVIYIKHDGSLGGNGMELVTHPCTLSYHRNVFPWEEIMKTARSYGYRSHETDTCGLHVHVNRTALGLGTDQQEATIAKIALLMERFWDTLVKFSRRNYSQLHWCKKLNIDVAPDETDQELINKIAKSRTVYHDDRYYALNLTNSNTIEFRVFRGTLKYETLMATLQFVRNIVTWAREHTVRETLKCTWNEFALSADYPELKAYMESRGIINTEGADIHVEPFKVGDKVMVRPDLDTWADENDIGWLVDDMYDAAGEVFVIASVTRDPDCGMGSTYYYELKGNMYSWGAGALIRLS